MFSFKFIIFYLVPKHLRRSFYCYARVRDLSLDCALTDILEKYFSCYKL